MSDVKQPFRIRDREFLIGSDDVIAVSRREEPRRVNSYYVELGGRRFPPKQLLRAIVGPDVVFDSGVAVRVIQSLGFKIIRTEKENANDR